MIEARVHLDSRGGLARFDSTGHSLFAPVGTDIVCAAFSVLARSAFESLAAVPGVAVHESAAQPGEYSVVVDTVPPQMVERVAGIAGFLIVGLAGLQRDFPQSVRLTIE